MDVTTSVSYTINVNTVLSGGPVRFSFASRDIGCTQGTTLCYNGLVIAQYRPGTRYWDRALEIAQDVLKKTFERMELVNQLMAMDEFTTTLQDVLKTEQCSPWDGSDLDGGME